MNSCHQASKSIQDTSSAYVEDTFVDAIDTGGELVDTADSTDTASSDTDVEDTSLDTSTPQEDPWENLYLEDTFFKSTHNSYSGEERGTILEQLENGVRGIEYDGASQGEIPINRHPIILPSIIRMRIGMLNIVNPSGVWNNSIVLMVG